MEQSAIKARGRGALLCRCALLHEPDTLASSRRRPALFLICAPRRLETFHPVARGAPQPLTAASQPLTAGPARWQRAAAAPLGRRLRHTSASRRARSRSGWRLPTAPAARARPGGAPASGGVQFPAVHVE